MPTVLFPCSSHSWIFVTQLSPQAYLKMAFLDHILYSGFFHHIVSICWCSCLLFISLEFQLYEEGIWLVCCCVSSACCSAWYNLQAYWKPAQWMSKPMKEAAGWGDENSCQVNTSQGLDKTRWGSIGFGNWESMALELLRWSVVCSPGGNDMMTAWEESRCWVIVEFVTVIG